MPKNYTFDISFNVKTHLNGHSVAADDYHTAIDSIRNHFDPDDADLNTFKVNAAFVNGQDIGIEPFDLPPIGPQPIIIAPKDRDALVIYLKDYIRIEENHGHSLHNARALLARLIGA